MIDINEFAAAVFTPSSRHEKATGDADALLLLFGDRKIALCRSGDSWRLPQLKDYPHWGETALFCGHLDGHSCYAASVAAIEPELEFCELREMLRLLAPGPVAAVSRGAGLLNWLKSRRYCGECGQAMEFSDLDMSRVCPACKAVAYPVIAPAIIVAVTRGDRLLLASNRNFRPGLYSLVAGFVECGEALEDTVRREVREEVGIEVGNIRYFGSQSWPFPASLMVGFIAEYAGGELHPDGEEIIAADWFSAERLPDLPTPGTISRRIIDTVLAGMGH